MPDQSLLIDNAMKSSANKLISDGPVCLAIDPLDRQAFKIRRALRAIEVFDLEADIEPVSVLMPSDLGWPAQISEFLREEFVRRAQDRFQKLIRSVGENCAQPKLILCPKESQKQAIDLLLAHASRRRSKMITILARKSAHQWTGLGSFAEAVLVKTKTPVLILGRKAIAPRRLKTVFFPTDLSPSSRLALRSLVEWSKRRNVEILLFHHEPVFAPRTYAEMGVVIESDHLRRALMRQEKSTKAKLERWVQHFSKSGVKCTLIVDYRLGALEKKMEAAIKNSEPDLVALGINRGKWSQILFGRTLRHVIHHSKVPVLVLHA